MQVSFVEKPLHFAAYPSLHWIIGLIGGVIGVAASVFEVTADDGAFGGGEWLVYSIYLKRCLNMLR